MSEKTSWEDVKNGKPLPPIETHGSNGSGVKTERKRSENGALTERKRAMTEGKRRNPEQ